MTELGRIYIIKNTVNDKVYIGQTHVSIKLRFQNHLSAARRGLDYVIGKAIRKYGEDKFYVELLEECSIKNLNDREKHWIAEYNSTNNKFGYNMSTGGNVTRTTRDIDEQEVLTLFEAGYTSCKIAKEYHVHPYKIATILKKYNIVYGIDKQRTSDEITEEIIKLYLVGYSTVDISKKFNINKSTVRRILNRRGVKLRSFKETKNLGRNLPTFN